MLDFSGPITHHIPNMSESEQSTSRSYCNLFSMSSLGAVRQFGFDRKWIFTMLWPLGLGPTLHQHVKFQYHLAIGGRVIDHLVNYSSPILRGPQTPDGS